MPTVHQYLRYFLLHIYFVFRGFIACVGLRDYYISEYADHGAICDFIFEKEIGASGGDWFIFGTELSNTFRC